jgi:hypothetical protein
MVRGGEGKDNPGREGSMHIQGSFVAGKHYEKNVGGFHVNLFTYPEGLRKLCRRIP